MDEKEKLLAKMLKSRRGELGISMSEVVDALAKSGININEKTLYGYENAVSRPSIRTFLALCRIYGVTNPLEYFEDSI